MLDETPDGERSVKQAANRRLSPITRSGIAALVV